MRIAVAGLALSHPEAFSRLAREQGAAIDSVWDPDRAKAEAFAAQFGCAVAESPAQAAARRPDGAMVTCVAADHLAVALPFLEGRVPTFVDKVLAVTPAGLAEFLAVRERTGTPLFSSSSLRYARDYVTVQELLTAGRAGTLLGAAATVCHTVEGYLQPGNTWQDEIHRGGGTIMGMGVHGVEPLVALLGPGVATVQCCRARRVLTGSQSEDTAVITLQWHDGKVGTVHIMGATKCHGYDLTVFGREACLRAEAPSAAVRTSGGAAFGTAHPLDDYGYTGLVRAMLSMFATGEEPVPLAETEEVVRILLAARLSAADGRVVRL